ncbi:MAG TPA: hypothetical protein VJB12_01155 [Candidatus Nanoarchaeia archaeon]|nr:hypothetical protein [Candidatus Nanoarchaeia archaeon]
MEEEDIEAFYEEQKQKLSDEYMDQLDKGADKDKAAGSYTLKFNQLNAKYNEMMGKALLRKGKKSPLRNMQDKARSVANKVLRR